MLAFIHIVRRVCVPYLPLQISIRLFIFSQRYASGLYTSLFREGSATLVAAFALQIITANVTESTCISRATFIRENAFLSKCDVVSFDSCSCKVPPSPRARQTHSTMYKFKKHFPYLKISFRIFPQTQLERWQDALHQMWHVRQENDQTTRD